MKKLRIFLTIAILTLCFGNWMSLTAQTTDESATTENNVTTVATDDDDEDDPDAKFAASPEQMTDTDGNIVSSQELIDDEQIDNADGTYIGDNGQELTLQEFQSYRNRN